MSHELNERAVFEAIKNQDWDRAIAHAKLVPANWDIWQRLPSAGPMPDHVVNHILDVLGNKHSTQHQNLNSFLFEFASHLPHWQDNQPLENETLNRVAEHGMDDAYVTNHIFNHPHFVRSPKNQLLSQATDFWHGYEKSVQPHHFAMVKSMYSGKPEELKDHRGQMGSSKDHMHLIPALLDHSKEVQKKVMEDETLPKRFFKGEPYVKLYRGVNGHYGKLIRDKAKYNPESNEVAHKNFIIPTAHLTSWTADPKMAARFVWGRTNIENQPGDQGVVMSQWVPVKTVLHSGFHKTNPGQQHAHEDESELVVGHPQGNFKISTSAMQFQPKPLWRPDQMDQGSIVSAHNYGDMALPNVKKSEYPVETIDLFDIMTASLNDPDVLVLEKNMMKKLVPAATALALLGAPQEHSQVLPHENMPAHVQQLSEQEPVQAIQRMPPTASLGLKPIKMIESSLGQNTQHKLMNKGPHAGTSAYGAYGLMPMTIMETINKNPHLKNKYPKFNGLDFKKDNDTIHKLMDAYPMAETDIANAHWQRLGHIFNNDRNKMAHAWLNGVTATLRAPEDVINAHPYVQKYNKFQKMMELEKKYETNTMQKSEQYQQDKEKGSFPDVSKFTPFTEVMQNQKSVREINEAIASGQIHDISNVGKFTHSSFVAGFSPDNSWLIKVEPFGERPGIESVRYGLQTIKEVAFYYLANRVFNMGMFTPHAILGEVTKGDKQIPAVAIRMYPQAYISAVDMDKERPRSVQGILEKYRRSGDLHKMAIMLYILGEADSHGNNILTDGSSVKLIDHGSSFGDMKFDPAHEKNVFVPYFMRSWGYKDSMSPEERFSVMPKIDNQEVEERVRHWLLSLSKFDMIDIMKKFALDPAPEVERLQKLQEMVKTMPVDAAVNMLWTKGMEAQ